MEVIAKMDKNAINNNNNTPAAAAMHIQMGQ